VRRLVIVVSALFAASFLVSIASLSAQSGPAAEQYDSSDGSETLVDATETSDDSDDTSFVSQGSGGGDTPEARAAQADLAEEGRLPDYHQVVDNITRSRFTAPGWEHVSGNEASHGADHAVARAGSRARKATYRFKIPTTNDYAVYAWWTASKKNATAARFEISTASGPRTERVNETKEGGMWIKLGDFEMKKGERTVQVSPSEDARVVADAVAVVRGTDAPPDETVFTGESGDTFRTTATRSTATRSDIVRVARKYKGTKYRYAKCTLSLMSCTCETRKAVAPFGHKFPMTELGQWRYEPSKRIKYRSDLRPGDIVFFREPYPPTGLDHVGVYSGRGMIVHSSSYWGKVVEREMKWIKGFAGAIRVNPR